MKINTIRAKSILSSSKIHDYVVNPYVGCQHACTYCYARFMKRFTGHREPWGNFVDVKINAPDLLKAEIKKKRVGSVWMSGVCDPYQPLEAGYELSRSCLAILAREHWPVVVQTRSPLVLRDMDIFKRSKNITVGLSITTASDDIRMVFEPRAPPIRERLSAVETLHANGIRTYVMIAPILPEAEHLVGMLAGRVDEIVIDRMNYHYADRIYARHGWREKRTDDYFDHIGRRIACECDSFELPCRPAY